MEYFHKDKLIATEAMHDYRYYYLHQMPAEVQVTQAKQNEANQGETDQDNAEGGNHNVEEVLATEVQIEGDGGADEEGPHEGVDDEEYISDEDFDLPQVIFYHNREFAVLVRRLEKPRNDC
ncbi:hypothetical protein RND81_10G044100 [Saponaria officinalis]|uniref:Uncharacterized protein n=1 Tax=Saponaria officinalis TaxID=3572 RepID=A0AAW1I0H4_SAPOF